MIGNTGIILDEVTPLLERINNAAVAKGLVLVGARAVGSLVKEHLYGIDQQRHRFGFHFFRQAADSVTTRSVPQGASVNITQLGFRQRLKGGTITAGQNGSGRIFLSIPDENSPEAHRQGAREMHDLHLTRRVNPKTGRMQWCLVRNLSTPIAFRKRKQKDGSFLTRIVAGAARGGEVIFWLTHSITQRPDPTVLPYVEQMSATAIDAIKTEMLRLARGTGGYQS